MRWCANDEGLPALVGKVRSEVFEGGDVEGRVQLREGKSAASEKEVMLLLSTWSGVQLLKLSLFACGETRKKLS